MQYLRIYAQMYVGSALHCRRKKGSSHTGLTQCAAQAPDQPTAPQEPIRKMSSSFPNNEASPFFDPAGEPMRPMARLSLVRQRLYEKSCDEQGRPGGLEGEDHDAESTNRGTEALPSC